MPAPTSIRDTRVKRFSPMGASDSLDATDEFPGACSQLVNLVPDLSTRNVWGCRPAGVQIFSFQNSPNLITGHNAGAATIYKVVGTIVYGLFVDSTANNEVPFAYNLSSNAWIMVTGTGINPSPGIGGGVISGGISPVPTIDLMGHFLVVTHPGFVSPNFIGWFDLTTPTAPVWHTGDLDATGAIKFATVGVPAWVKQFNGRAYFGCNNQAQPAVIATDALALKCTNASQTLTFGDNLLLTAAGTLGLSNQLGGIIQSLMVFKSINNIYQITGDFATTNLTINTLSVATGTLFPNSICKTPVGLAFLSPSGLRIIDQSATVSDPIGAAGRGIAVPFIVNNNQLLPYAAASCDSTTIRIFVSSLLGVQQEYWYNIVRKAWSGPHSFHSYIFDIYNGSFLTATEDLNFVNPPGLIISATDPTANSVFTEGNTALTFAMQSAVLEDNTQMAGSELAEMQVVASAAANNTMTVALLDPNGNTINTSSIIVNSSGLWPYRVDFPSQSVFNRAAISITGNSAAGVRLGDTWMRLKTLGYIPPPPNPPSS